MTTQARLKEVLRYDPESGEFFWRVKPSKKIRIGNHAGTVTQGYRRIVVDGVRHAAHRLAWLYAYSKFPDGLLDHINRNPLDNRITNLREATKVQNARNSKARKSRSGLKGVIYTRRGKWESRLQTHEGGKWLGYFDTAEKAHEAYCAAAKAHYGEFWNPGYPGVNSRFS